MPDQDAIATASPPPTGVGPITQELSILDGLYVLARHRRLIFVFTILGLVLGIVVGFITPAEYESSAVLMREAQQETGGGSLAALRGLGINLGESQSGLSIEAYPNVLMSHEVRSLLLDESFPQTSGTRVTFLDYARDAEPGGLGDRLRRLFRSGSAQSGILASADTLAIAYTFEEERAMETMREMIGVDADAESGLMTVTVTAQDPVLAASFVGRLVEELRARVQALLTQKAREDYEFILQRTDEAEAELNGARAVLARFDDRNRGLTSPLLVAERDRLRQDVSFATEVFGQYQGELKQAEIAVQRASPVVTVLDRPVVPLLPVRPRRKVVVLIGALFGLAGGLVLAFVIEGFRTEAGTEGGRKKSAAIREAIRPQWLRRGKSVRDETESEDDSIPGANP